MDDNGRCTESFYFSAAKGFIEFGAGARTINQACSSWLYKKPHEESPVNPSRTRWTRLVSDEPPRWVFLSCDTVVHLIGLTEVLNGILVGRVYKSALARMLDLRDASPKNDRGQWASRPNLNPRPLWAVPRVPSECYCPYMTAQWSPVRPKKPGSEPPRIRNPVEIGPNLI
jgi:hypothetical protein